MLTEFGKELRKLRIDKNETLSSMSKKMDISISYLSAIENGIRDIPIDFIDKLVEIYKLSNKKRDVFLKAFANSTKKIDISLNSTMNEQRELAIMLSRKINDLTKDECQKIMEIIGGDKNE
jgi:HTH-type transcriptional regulator, competence development regulator